VGRKPTVINEAKIGFNGTKTRISGFAPAIPGVDTSAFAVSFTGTVAIPESVDKARPPAQRRSANLIRSKFYPERPWTALHELHAKLRRQPERRPGSQQTSSSAWKSGPVRLYYGPAGGTTYLPSPALTALLANTPSQIQVLGDVSARPVQPAAPPQPLPQANLFHLLRSRMNGRSAASDHELRPALRILQRASMRTGIWCTLRCHQRRVVDPCDALVQQFKA